MSANQPSSLSALSDAISSASMGRERMLKMQVTDREGNVLKSEERYCRSHDEALLLCNMLIEHGDFTLSMAHYLRRTFFQGYEKAQEAK